MPALLELQRSFSAALLSESVQDVARHILEDGFSAAERLRIYRNTCRSTLVATLRMTYPAVDRLVGSEFFDAAAGRYVARCPAATAYLNQYGHDFAQFLAGLPSANSVPYLADVARFEWALSVAANAEDTPVLEAGALLSVARESHARLCFVPHPSVTFLALRYPADHIADAVLSGNEAAMAEVDLSSGPVYLVVHRGREGLDVQRLDRRAYGFALRLCGGESLSELLQFARDDTAALLCEQLAKGRLTTYEMAQ
ncbi:MAG TPA: DNA-binding domain-containing protein [Burkholderiales bacterium]|nr:DNA-binding domain-containing protein [Burkholderiales bacterium]